MILTERHIIKLSNSMYKELDNLCFLSKNLYNSTLYTIRQYYFQHKKHLSYTEVNKLFSSTNQSDYRALPSKVSQQVQKLVEQNFKSFFSLIKNKSNKARLPKYLDKVKGRFVTTYTNQAISFKNNIIKLSGTSIFIKTNVTNVNQVRIIPKNNHYVIEILYTVKEKDLLTNNNKYASIDLGVNNLATITFNEISTNKLLVNKSLIINGKPIKSINQFYNKKVSYLKSKLCNTKTSKLIRSITNNRNNKINDYLHKSSKYIINQLVDNSINTLVIGYNKDWKQEINIGTVNNQTFVTIPHIKFINMLQYKCKLNGINCILVNESYTSKCSALDNELICKHDTYVGKRIKRGLFKTSTGKVINADVNGSINIVRKVIGELVYPIEVCSTLVDEIQKLNPVIYTIKYN